MPFYKYEAFDKLGQKTSGTLESSSLKAARDLIKDRGMFPAKIAVVESLQQEGFRLASLFERQVDFKSKIRFTKQLSTLLRSGVPLLGAIELLVLQFEGQLKRILIDVKDRLKAGESLAASLGQYPRIFSNVYVQLVRAGEASGRLENILEGLLEYLTRAEETRKRIRRAMSYPIMMISFSLAVVAVMLLFVVPRITQTFAQTGKSLPPITEALIAISSFFTSNYLALAAVLPLVFVLFLYLKSTYRGRLLLDRLVLRLPLTSYFSRTKAVVQFSKTLGLLLESGVNLSESLDIVANIVDNMVLRDELHSAREKIIKEGKIASYLKETQIFPPIATYMIRTGEESGELSGMLLTVGKDYEEELSEITDGLVSKINPIMMLVVGGIIFFIVLAMFLPIFQLGEALGL